MMATTEWPRSWDSLPSNPTDNEIGKLFESTARRYQAMNKALLVQSESNARSARRMARRLLHSDTAKFASVVKSASHSSSYKDCLGHAQGRRKLLAIAKAASAWIADEPAERFAQEKNDGGVRMLTRLSFAHSAMNRLSLATARSLMGPTPHRLSGAVSQMLDVFNQALPAAALVLTADIPRCFDNLKHEAVKVGLGLPARVMEKQLFEVNSKATLYESLSKGLLVPPGTIVQSSSPAIGIPSGAALSAAAADWVMREIGREMEAVAPGIRFYHLSDNIVIFAANKDDGVLLQNRLMEVAKKFFGLNAAGELSGRITKVISTAPFLFAGSWFRQAPNGVERSLDSDRINNFVDRILVRLGDATTLAELDAIKASINGWFAQSTKDKNCTKAFSELNQHLGEMKFALNDKAKAT